jgi:hypothetical protein
MCVDAARGVLRTRVCRGGAWACVTVSCVRGRGRGVGASCVRVESVGKCVRERGRGVDASCVHVGVGVDASGVGIEGEASAARLSSLETVDVVVPHARALRGCASRLESVREASGVSVAGDGRQGWTKWK